MYTTRALVVAVFVAVAHARYVPPRLPRSGRWLTYVNHSFGRENAVQGVIAAIGGNNGQAATLAGASIGTLLAGANACAKVREKNTSSFGIEE